MLYVATSCSSPLLLCSPVHVTCAMAFIKGEIVGRLDEDGVGWMRVNVKPLLELPQTSIKRSLPEVDDAVKLKRPTGQTVKNGISNGLYPNTHATKRTLTCTQISAEINAVEKQCGLTRLEWSAEAQKKLEEWLSTPKRARTTPKSKAKAKATASAGPPSGASNSSSDDSSNRSSSDEGSSSSTEEMGEATSNGIQSAFQPSDPEEQFSDAAMAVIAQLEEDLFRTDEQLKMELAENDELRAEVRRLQGLLAGQ